MITTQMHIDVPPDGVFGVRTKGRRYADRMVGGGFLDAWPAPTYATSQAARACVTPAEHDGNAGHGATAERQW